MNKDQWIKQKVNNQGSFSGLLIFYAAIVLTFVAIGVNIT